MTPTILQPQTGNNLYVGFFNIIKIFSPGLIRSLCIACVLLSCSAPRQLGTTAGPNAVRFRTIGLIPVMEINLNGKPGYFIIDTGASVSILNESEAEHYEFKVHKNSSNKNVMGFGGASALNVAVNCKLQIGSLEVKNTSFKSKDMRDLAAVLSRTERVRLAGILGSDMFSRYKMSIDFNTKTVSCQVL